MKPVPSIRLRRLNDAPTNERGEFVVYWMIAQRRTVWNFALQRAVETAKERKQPLLVFEPLRCDYKWASDRLHRFVIQGMANHKKFFARRRSVEYYPYVEPKRGADHGLLAELAKHASAIVTDDFPTFFLPRMLEVVGPKIQVPMEAVDSNGLLPMRSSDREFTRAHSFRRFMQHEFLNHLDDFPEPDPTQDAGLPAFAFDMAKIYKKWPSADEAMLTASPEVLAKLPIDHAVGPAAFDGGQDLAADLLAEFLDSRLPRYADERNEPDSDAASGFSPYLHFGHLSVHQVFRDLMAQEQWGPQKLRDRPNGSREGWWGVEKNAESFLDELITWRELGYHFADRRRDYNLYSSLPDWAKVTLAEHASDDRPHVYTLEEFEHSRTHDPLWNAAQRQIVREGRMHNYMRMLWGKKILHWTASPQDALAIMLELNNKYGVDGRNPNSYSGIFWVLGRYDRAWGPEREIFGKIRYMTSDSTERKFNVKNYLRVYGA